MSDPDETPTPPPTDPQLTYLEIHKNHRGASRFIAHGFAEWMLAEAKRSPDASSRRSMSEVFAGPLTIELRVNGEEIPFFPTMEAAFEIHQNIIRDLAGEMFRGAMEEKFTDQMRALSSRLFEVQESAEREIRRLTREAFPNVWLEGDDRD